MTIEEYIVERLNHLEFENTKLKNDKEKLKNKFESATKTIETYETLFKKAKVEETEYWFSLSCLSQRDLTERERDTLRELITQEKEERNGGIQ